MLYYAMKRVEQKKINILLLEYNLFQQNYKEIQQVLRRCLRFYVLNLYKVTFFLCRFLTNPEVSVPKGVL